MLAKRTKIDWLAHHSHLVRRSTRRGRRAVSQSQGLGHASHTTTTFGALDLRDPRGHACGCQYQQIAVWHWVGRTAYNGIGNRRQIALEMYYTVYSYRRHANWLTELEDRVYLVFRSQVNVYVLFAQRKTITVVYSGEQLILSWRFCLEISNNRP